MSIIDINSGTSVPPQVTGQPSTQINVDLSSAPEVVCESCGQFFFQEVTFFKRLSALVSPTGKEAIVPLSTYACVNCGNINKEFMPVRINQSSRE